MIFVYRYLARARERGAVAAHVIKSGSTFPSADTLIWKRSYHPFSEITVEPTFSSPALTATLRPLSNHVQPTKAPHALQSAHWH